MKDLIKMKGLLILVFLLFSLSLFGKELKISRDKTMVKDGPGNFYENIFILKAGAKVESLGASKEDKGWIEVRYQGRKGYISELALKDAGGGDMFGSDFEDPFGSGGQNQIAPGSYTAAIKGFALNYARKKGFKKYNLDDIMALTNFSSRDFLKVKRETKMAYFPRNDELIGGKEGFINDRMEAVGLSVSMGVLEQGVLFDRAMTRRLNVIANLMVRQTYDYDKRYRVWIIKDSEPVAFSGPGGYIFISDSMMKLLNDYREVVAIIAHEIGHIIMRHGIEDVAVAQARYSAEQAFDELDMDIEADEYTLALDEELEEVIAQAVDACALVRDDKQEFEADKIAIELMRRYKIDKMYLKRTLEKVYSKTRQKYPEYKSQMDRRIKAIK